MLKVKGESEFKTIFLTIKYNQMKNKLHVQGDVALKPVAMPTGERKESKTGKILAFGEVSGHHHIITGTADVFEVEGKTYVLANGDGASLEHLTPTKQKADHNPIMLERNTCYEVILQNNYNPYSKLMERVSD